MKKEVSLTIAIVLLTIFFSFLKYPIQNFIDNFSIENSLNELISSSLSRILLAIVLIFILFKLHFTKLDFFGLKIENEFQLVIPFTIVILGVIMKINFYESLSLSVLFMFIIYCLLIAIVEEVLFRGIVFSLLINLFKDYKNGLYLAMIFSSVIFGTIHYLNLFKISNFHYVTNQVIFAILIGYLASGFLLAIKSIYPVILLHFIYNFGFGTSFLELNPKLIEAKTDASLLSFLISIVFAISIIFLSNYYAKYRLNDYKFIDKFKFLKLS